eukprot:3661106-Rhodomonas_salina.2
MVSEELNTLQSPLRDRKAAPEVPREHALLRGIQSLLCGVLENQVDFDPRREDHPEPVNARGADEAGFVARDGSQRLVVLDQHHHHRVFLSALRRSCRRNAPRCAPIQGVGDVRACRRRQRRANPSA